MNKEEIETRIDVLEKTIEIVRERISELKAQKPKIRHGDYGITNYPEPRINFPLLAMKANMPDKLLKVAHSDGSGRVGVDEDINWLGNIFDDLKALGKPLEEFTVGDLHFKIEGTVVDIEDESDETFFYFPYKHLSEIILNLRRMEAWQEAKQ